MDEEEVELSTLRTFAQQLQSCLQWDPINGQEGPEKQGFVEALTEIAALPLDSISMEIRRLLVADMDTQEAPDIPPQTHFRNVIAALNARDVQLKCKAANAVGSLCISRVAGQQLLELYGQQVLSSVSKMATRKNQWVQGDAFFVLGWMVVIADEDTLTAIAELIPTVIKHLHRNVNLLQTEGEPSTKSELASSEQASNFRVYALVLLLNFSQRHVEVFTDQLDNLLPMLRDLLEKLLGPVPEESTTSTIKFYDASEHTEVLRLTVTLLSVLVDQLEAAALQLLELKVLPSLLKLKRVLDTPDIQQLIDEAGIQDITERLEAVIETLLNCR
ncbi:hypothetical protein V7S43_014648 [Phytophthora oleae]|uniref:Nucleotide exchange factor Fes1 domain-containing protein n=1 Tax=Phytophthora oleae TaxID=2107226 RepID=A0ABD3F4U2_9STRA